MKDKVETLASNGCGFFRHEGKATFVPWTVPEDQIEWSCTKDKGRFSEGSLLKVVEPSKDRVSPPCPWFQECGGCQLQMASYDSQLHAKSQWIFDAFSRVGRCQLSALPSMCSGKPYAYRRRIGLRLVSSSNGTALAYAGVQGPLQSVFPDRCLLLSDQPVLKEVSDLLMQAKRLGAWEGRVWIYRWGDRFACWCSVRNGGKSLFSVLQPLLLQTHWQALAVEEEGTLYQAGEWRLIEELHGISFHLSPYAFLQGHRELSRELWSDLVTWACQKQGSILDLYSGIGVTGTLCAARNSKVTMVEAAPSLTAAAIRTLQEHNIEAEVLTGTVEDVLPHLKAHSFDTLLLNPPRPGCSNKAIEELLRLRPARISYVSCHPATCARDIQKLSGYRLERLVGYDLFPQTAHVECWATLVDAESK